MLIYCLGSSQVQNRCYWRMKGTLVEEPLLGITLEWLKCDSRAADAAGTIYAKGIRERWGVP